MEIPVFSFWPPYATWRSAIRVWTITTHRRICPPMETATQTDVIARSNNFRLNSIDFCAPGID